jgi:hypothetical protein
VIQRERLEASCGGEAAAFLISYASASNRRRWNPTPPSRQIANPDTMDLTDSNSRRLANLGSLAASALRQLKQLLHC